MAIDNVSVATFFVGGITAAVLVLWGLMPIVAVPPLYVLGVFSSSEPEHICQAPHCHAQADRRFAVIYQGELSVYHLCDSCAGIADTGPLRQISLPRARLDYSTVPGDGCRQLFTSRSY